MRSSKWTRRRTTSHLGGSSTAGNRAPKRWGASSAVTFLRRPGTTGSITASTRASLHQLLLSGRGILRGPEGYPGPFLFPERFVQFAAPPHLVHVRGNIEGLAFSQGPC